MFAIFAVSGLVAPRPAAAAPDKRVALVIGNSAYTVAPALPNPVADAKAIAAALKRLNFEVVEGYDLNYTGMRETLGRFASTMVDSRAALVYYAGHGVAVDEENFLLPTDIALKNAADLDLNSISLSLVLKQMKREERVNVVILDACRNNPFARELGVGTGRSIASERGLTRVDGDLAKGMMIAFATDPKATAMDGPAGQNSPFTKALLRHIETPAIPIDSVMNRVRAEVWEETRNKQMPWVNTSIIGEFVLNPGAAVAPPAASAALTTTRTDAEAGPALTPAPDRAGLDVRFWESAERGGTAEDYRAYLSAWPNGLFVSMAKSRIARIEAPKPDAVKAEASQPQQLAALPADRRGEPAQSPGAQTAATAPQSQDAPATAASELDPKTKAEVGTTKTEAALKLAKAARIDAQARLGALGHDPGPANGEFTQKTREAIAAWQGSQGIATTGWLAPLALAALKVQSEPKLAAFLKANEEMARGAEKAARVRADTARAIKAEQARRVAPRTQRVQRRVAPEGGYAYGEPPVYRQPPPHRRGPPPPPGYGGGLNPGIGGFLGGVAAGAILGGAFRR